ncbi:MAG TPA: DUF488 domain-containing protein [Acidobacteriaceae bacterium]
MDARPLTLVTIGYEGADLADFVATLRAVNVLRIIDVRELAISRRKGFAKKALSAALAGVGIEYVHLRGLGDPKPGREAARAGDDALFRKVFASHMDTVGARADLKVAERLVSKGGACLMCFERDHTACHRSIVAEAISGMVPISIRHVGVKVGLARSCLRIGACQFS